MAQYNMLATMEPRKKSSGRLTVLPTPERSQRFLVDNYILGYHHAFRARGGVRFDADLDARS